MNNMKRLAILILALLSVPSFAAAQKRRSVGTPEVDSRAAVTVSCQGTVTDAVTGLPVAFTTITSGRFRVVTSRSGKFSLSAVTALGEVDVTAGRTGYHSSTVRISSSGTHELNFRLQSRPTTTLRKIDGTTVALDDDSVRFGYVVPFANYQTATGNDFCMTNGTQEKIPLAQMMRITAPATSVPTSCCQRAGQQVRLELRDGTLHDATFIDSCYGYSVDIIGRDHVRGVGVFVPFGEVSEIVFP